MLAEDLAVGADAANQPGDAVRIPLGKGGMGDAGFCCIGEQRGARLGIAQLVRKHVRSKQSNQP